MVQLQNYLKGTNEYGNKNLPLLNTLFVERFSQFSPYSIDLGFKEYIRWARRSPQIMGFLNVIATDILSDSIEFNPLKEGESGRNKRLKAKAFWEANKGVDVAEEMIYDLLLLGIGYNWLGTINDVQLKEFCQTVAREILPGKETKELEMKAQKMFEIIKTDKADKLAKKLRHIAASTVSLQTDGYQIRSVTQRVGVSIQVYDPDEVLMFRLMPLDGKVYPYPPMESLLAEIYLLWLITQNYISFFENGGKPDNVFILPKELAGSKNHAYLIDTLTKYKKIQNKHGNLVFTGDLSIEQLSKVEHEMENKELGLYIVGVLAMFYGVPVGRIPFLVGKAASGGDAGGLADSGYWRKISVWQSKLEAEYNYKLWNPFFGVSMKFSRGYLQDEVRETQNEMQKTSVAEQRMRLGLWTAEKAGTYLDIDPEDVQEAQEEKKQRDIDEAKTGMLRQNLENNGNVIPHPDARAKAKQKQETQLGKQSGGKRINP